MILMLANGKDNNSTSIAINRNMTSASLLCGAMYAHDCVNTKATMTNSFSWRKRGKKGGGCPKE